MERHPKSPSFDISWGLAALTKTHEAKKQPETISYWYREGNVVHIAVHSLRVRNEILSMMAERKIFQHVEFTVVEPSCIYVEGLDPPRPEPEKEPEAA